MKQECGEYKKIVTVLIAAGFSTNRTTPGFPRLIFSIVLEDLEQIWGAGLAQGWRSGESARLPPVCPRFDSRTRHHMWAEFAGSLLCSERFFSGNSGFPLSSKTNI